MIELNDGLKAQGGPLLELDTLLASFHQQVWNQARACFEVGEDVQYDLVAVDEAKAIQLHVRHMMATDRNKLLDQIDQLKEDKASLMREHTKLVEKAVAKALADAARDVKTWPQAGPLSIECNGHDYGDKAPWHVTDGTNHAIGATPNEALNQFSRYVTSLHAVKPPEVWPTDDELLRILTEYEGALQTAEDEDPDDSEAYIKPARDALMKMLGDVRTALIIIETKERTAPMTTHPDSHAVDEFAKVMKARLAEKRAQGFGGWEQKDLLSEDQLSRLFHKLVCKGSPVDVANLAMMLHVRGEKIVPAHVVDPADPQKGYLDEKGDVWDQPTAWAYVQVCKALHQWREQAHGFDAQRMLFRELLKMAQAQLETHNGEQDYKTPRDFLDQITHALLESPATVRARGLATQKLLEEKRHGNIKSS